MPQLNVKVANTAPDEPALTAYDKEHAVTYARLLDAEADNADWREVARIVLRIDPATEPERARLDSSLRDVKEDDSNNEVAPSRGGEQIDDVLDGFVGAVVGGFKSAVWAILRVRTAVEAAVGKWSAQPFVEEQKKQRDLNTL